LGGRDAKAERISIQDSDDLCLPNHLDVPHGYVMSHPEVGMVFANGEYLGGPVHNGSDQERRLLDNIHVIERLVQDAWKRLMVGRATVVIAHRRLTIRKADRIVVLFYSMIVERKTHDELLARKAEHNKLYSSRSPIGAMIEQDKVLQ
jgi:hypothetical protein